MVDSDLGGLIPLGYSKLESIRDNIVKIVVPTDKYLLVDCIGRNIGFRGCRICIGTNRNPEASLIPPFKSTSCIVKYKVDSSGTVFYLKPNGTYVTLYYHRQSNINSCIMISESEIPEDAINLLI